MHLHGMLFRVVERSSGVIHPGERGWKDTIGVLPDETVTVQPWFIPYAGPLRLPLPFARARRQGDDAAAGGGQVRRSLGLGDRARVVVAAPAPAQADDGLGHRHWTRSCWDKPVVDVEPGDTVDVDVPRHGAGPQRPDRVRPPNGLLSSRRRCPPPPFSQPFDTDGATSRSSARCTRTRCAASCASARAPPPAPPPPLSQQAYNNDDAAVLPAESRRHVRQGQAEAVVGLGQARGQGRRARAPARLGGLRRQRRLQARRSHDQVRHGVRHRHAAR